MAVQYDARGNEFFGQLDAITGQVLTDARTSTASLAAVNAEGVSDLNGHSCVAVHLQAGAVVTATFVFEGTLDGTNYFALPAVDVATGAQVASIALAAATISKVFYVQVAGFRRYRTRVSAYTSGTVIAAHRATTGPMPVPYAPPFPTTLWVTATAAANTAATASLPAVAGMFHYITHIDITRNATAALAGTATIIHTTTNLPGSPAWSVGNAMAAGGTQLDAFIDFAVPLRSSVANTATTVVAAAGGAAVLGRVNVGYYIGP
jgi:hypothetical protein